MGLNVCDNQILLPIPEPCDDCETLKQRVDDLEDKVGGYIETPTVLTTTDPDVYQFKTVIGEGSTPSTIKLMSTPKILSELNKKSNKLKAGTNITLTEEADETIRIDATGGGGGNVNSVNGETGDVILDANDIEYDTGITIKQGMDSKQDKLTAGENITIENNVISATVDGGGLVVETTEREGDGSPKLTAEQCAQIVNAVKDGKECSVRLAYTEQSVEIKMMYKVLINGVMTSDRGDEGQFILLDEECREWIGYSVMGEDVRHRRKKISEGIRSINSKSGESVEITGTDIKVSDADDTTLAEKVNGITITTARIEDDIPQMSQEEALLIYNAVKSATNTKPQPVTIIYTNETTGDRQLLKMEYAETYDDVVVAFFTKDEICERYKYRITQDDVQGSIVKGSVDGVDTLNGKIGNVSIVAGENVSVTTSGNDITVSADKFDYAIGDVFSTNTNVNPSSRLGGTWSLLGVEMTPHNIFATGNTYLTRNTTDFTWEHYVFYVSGLTMSFHISLTTRKIINADVNVGSLKLVTCGLKDSFTTNQSPAYNAGSCKSGTYQVKLDQGTIELIDFNGTIPANTHLRFSIIIPRIQGTDILDSAIRRWDWVKTAN